MEQAATDWWKDAVIYQVYVRSFADASGDGVGDIAGIRSRLDYLQALGVDALWLNPCYVSPQHDHGYDIADYFAVDPAYGSVDELAELVRDAHDRGIRVLLDMVANHASVEHEWFREALHAPVGSAERAHFIFRDGRGAAGELPPNNWQSVFGGPAWSRVGDERAGQWYLHSFDATQPDFDWRNDDVADYFDDVLEHWFSLGVDGFRIDVAHGMVKAADLADWPGADSGDGGHNAAMWDQPEVHDIYRRWRSVARAHAAHEPYFVGEIWVPSTERLEAYLAAGELDQAFSFDVLVQPWDAPLMRSAIERTLARPSSAAQPPAWTLSNHDVHRTVSRYGQEQDLTPPETTDMIAAARRLGAVDVELGSARARAAIMLLLALPGSVYLYQGEELGLPEVFDLPDEARTDPIWLRSGGAELGRDGCRVPLPWSASRTSLGFSPEGAPGPWLPQPSWFSAYAADAQVGIPGSMFEHYRAAIALRNPTFAGTTTIEWLEAPDDTLAFRRGPGRCVVNFSTGAVSLKIPPNAVVLASAPIDRGNPSGIVLPPNSAVWVVEARNRATDAVQAVPAR